MSDNLFKRPTSPEQAEDSHDSTNGPGSTIDFEAGIDSLQVELSVEDGSNARPAQGASEFFRFLEGPSSHDNPLKMASPGPTLLRSPMISALKPVTNSPHGPRPMQGLLHLRNGPKEIQTQLSPAPRRRQDPPPLPPIPPDFHFRSPGPGLPGLEHRSPTNDARHNQGNANTRVVSDTAISVASSVYPEVEATVDADPYTPIPKRIGLQKRGRNDSLADDSSPTWAPFRGRVRKYPEYAQSYCNKENAPSDLPSPKRRRQSPPENKGS